MGKPSLTETQAQTAARIGPVAASTTLLRQLLDVRPEHSTPYWLVRDEEGIIKGIIDLHHVQRMLASENPVERRRWEGMTVGAIADAVFAHPSPDLSESALLETASLPGNGFAIHDAAGCVALVTHGETYVNWSRVSTALRANHIDPVTHLPTRSSFERRLREELDRAARSNQALAILLIDLDHLKRINDQYGHTIGDATLRLVADSLRAGIRSYDFVSRYGGDEFAASCFDCKPQDVALPVARIQNWLARQSVTHLSTKIPISVSIGIAALRTVDEHCAPELLLEHADECMYRSKRSGRSTAFVIELDPFGIPLASPKELNATH